jgi:hypothetical protein
MKCFRTAARGAARWDRFNAAALALGAGTSESGSSALPVAGHQEARFRVGDLEVLRLRRQVPSTRPARIIRPDAARLKIMDASRTDVATQRDVGRVTKQSEGLAALKNADVEEAVRRGGAQEQSQADRISRYTADEDQPLAFEDELTIRFHKYWRLAVAPEGSPDRPEVAGVGDVTAAFKTQSSYDFGVKADPGYQ